MIANGRGWIFNENYFFFFFFDETFIILYSILISNKRKEKEKRKKYTRALFLRYIAREFNLKNPSLYSIEASIPFTLYSLNDDGSSIHFSVNFTFHSFKLYSIHFLHTVFFPSKRNQKKSNEEVLKDVSIAIKVYIIIRII